MKGPLPSPPPPPPCVKGSHAPFDLNIYKVEIHIYTYLHGDRERKNPPPQLAPNIGRLIPISYTFSTPSVFGGGAGGGA